MRIDDPTFTEQLQSLARLDNEEIVRAELDGVRPEDLAESFTRLPIEDSLAIIRLLDADTSAAVLVELPTEVARALIQELPDESVAHYLDILPMDDALDLREELGPERFDALLNVIPTEDAMELRRLLEYPEDSVGRLMTEDFFEVRPDSTMASVLEDIRLAPEGKYEMVNDIYVLDERRHLLGIFSLRKAIRAHPQTPASEMMNEDVVTCEAREAAEEAARRMAKYGFYALPVLDNRGRMVGIFTGDDAQSVLREEETEDVLKLGGVSGGAEAYLSLNVWQLIKRRLPWLLVLFVAEIFTGLVMRHYIGPEKSGADVLARLMVFVPLLIGMGGNSGSQVTSTITRALAVGEITINDSLLVLRREFLAALVIGLALGLVGFLRAYLGWGSGWHISVIVGLALPAIIVWATSVGSLLPLMAKRFGQDPAVMSAPFITTFVDATGLIIYFEIARRFVSF